MPIPSLVIFDCDGVLVDSESIANEVMARCITDSGWPMTGTQSQARFVGQRMNEVMATVAQKTGQPLPADWLNQFEMARNEAFRDRLRPTDGIADVLAHLTGAGVGFCVASSGSIAKMRFTLGLTGLLPALDGLLFSANDLERGKPFPDIFLHAAKAMGVAPVNCVVIEDSPAGAQAAQAAGMRCFGYAADSDAKTLQAFGATVFFSMAALPGLLGV